MARITPLVLRYLQVMDEMHRNGQKLIRVIDLTRKLGAKYCTVATNLVILKRKGLVENPMWGYYCISQKGRKVLRSWQTI
jgi:Mn-dependent DtxR family transcriptional regulator